MQDTVWLLLIVFSIIALATISFYIVKKLQPEKDLSIIQYRVNTWWGMFIVFCFATLFNTTVSLIAIMILSLVALREYFSMLKTRKSDRRIFLWSYLMIPLHFYWIYIGWYGMFIVFIPIYVFLFLPLPRIIGKGTVGFLRSVSFTQWGLMLMVFGLSHLAYFPIANPTFGGNLVLYLVVLTQLNDVIQYLTTVYIGKRKIVPTANAYISWEGFIVGLVITTCVSYLIFPYLTPLTPLFGIISGILISITGFIGSLTFSVLKRDLLIDNQEKWEKLKGRYLSRIDSLTYTAPIFFHVIRYYFDFM